MQTALNEFISTRYNEGYPPAAVAEKSLGVSIYSKSLGNHARAIFLPEWAALSRKIPAFLALSIPLRYTPEGRIRRIEHDQGVPV